MSALATGGWGSSTSSPRRAGGRSASRAVSDAAVRRRTCFVWHSWIGLTAGLLLFVVCWSGTVAVFSQDIDWLIDERLRAPPADSVAWQEIAQTFEAAHPGWRLNSLQAPLAPCHPAPLFLIDPHLVPHPALSLVVSPSFFYYVLFF